MFVRHLLMQYPSTLSRSLLCSSSTISWSGGTPGRTSLGTPSSLACVAEVREHAKKLLFQGVVDDGVLEVEADLLLDVGTVEGGPFGAAAPWI